MNFMRLMINDQKEFKLNTKNLLINHKTRIDNK